MHTYVHVYASIITVSYRGQRHAVPGSGILQLLRHILTPVTRRKQNDVINSPVQAFAT